MTGNETGIRIEGLGVVHNGSTLLRDISFTAPRGEVTVLLGPNGSGKTTLIESISGAVPFTSGEVYVDGTPVKKFGRTRRARLGLSHVEQGHRVFPALTVRENLQVAKGGRDIGEALELFPQLERRMDLEARLLSGGEQQMLVLARAVLTKPRVLLIDEMSLGLAPAITLELLPLLNRFADSGMTVLLVEQFASLALKHGDTAYVLAKRTIADSGPCADFLVDPERLHRAYFAGDDEGREVVE